ncbi:endonuclease III domain-containing protein [Aurantiacibacter arachoides]|uniref:endonuclease III domain-containing protein n=1 Tax=Aurantiacibacter arachoides TaxID=1850444 RepID=UPI0019CF33BA|nr:endonuclease III [Aurantiacibacter arachoides]GGD60035.1 endonuclease III [Aurantiacibacter arachoides]
MLQLDFGTDPRTDRLARIHAALIAAFGRIERPDERRKDPVWTLVQGVIGAQTRTPVSNASTDALRDAFGTWQGVADAELADIAAVLANQTFPAVAAERIRACFCAIIAQRGAVDLRHLSNLPDDAAMDWLQKLPGVGRKIAAGVMNTSLFARRALVIDGHHRRVMQRTGLVPPRADTARAYDVLMPLLPAEWSAAAIDEHHLLVKRLGQVHCRPSVAHCHRCPIAPCCDTGRGRAPG